MADESVDPQILANLMAGIGPGGAVGAVAGDKPADTSAIASSMASDQQAPQPKAPEGASSADVSQLVSSMSQGQAPPMVQGGLPASASNQVPRPTIGGLPGLIMDMIHPGRNVPAGQLAPTKKQHFEAFVGNFLTALAQGFAGEGHGPGAAMRGAGIAMQAPYQMQLQQYALEQQRRAQEAQIASEQAKTEQTEEQTKLLGSSVPVTLPNGQQIYLPYQVAQRAFPQQISGQYRVKGEEIKAENRLEVEALKTHLLQGSASRFIPDVEQDANGNKRYFYHVYNKFGKEIGQADVNAIKQFMGDTTSTFEIKQGEDGSLIRVPKVTTKAPMIPIKGGLSTPAGEKAGTPESSLPRVAGGGGKSQRFWYTGGYGMAAVPVLDSAGNPVFGKAPDNIRTMSMTAQATLPHLDDLKKELDDMERLGVLGEFKGKGTSFLAKHGFAVPNLTYEQRIALGKFIDDVKLVDSAMLRTHFGARGGQQMYEKFSEMLNAGEDPELIRGGLDSFQGFLEGYRDMINQHPVARGGGNPTQPTAGGGASSGGHLPGNPFAPKH